MNVENALTMYITKVLKGTREVVAKMGMDKNRLPAWVHTADIEFAHINNTSIFFVKPSANNTDSTEFIPGLSADTELFLGIDNVDPRKSIVDITQVKPFVSIRGDKPTTLKTAAPESVFYNIQEVKYHHPTSLWNIFLQINADNQPVNTVYIPFALYVHDEDLEQSASHASKRVKNICLDLKNIHDGDLGNYYESTIQQEISAYSSRIDNSVIVMGKFDGGEREEELETIRAFLNSRGYSASLIKYLPGHPARSIAHKAKTYALSSRFCVIVDIDASGHLVEYSELKNERIPIALLRKKNKGSSWMIEHEHQTNDYIELFEFNKNPLEVMDEVINWSDEYTEERINDLKKYYPSWKG